MRKRFLIIRRKIFDGAASKEVFTWLLGNETSSGCMFGVDSHPAGWISPERWKGWKVHPVEEIVHILKGKIHYQFGSDNGSVEEDTIAGAGDTIYVAKGVKHRAQVEGKEKFLGICFWPKGYSKEGGYLTRFTKKEGKKRKRISNI